MTGGHHIVVSLLLGRSVLCGSTVLNYINNMGFHEFYTRKRAQRANLARDSILRRLPQFAETNHSYAQGLLLSWNIIILHIKHVQK